jgi:hypothetical protein
MCERLHTSAVVQKMQGGHLADVMRQCPLISIAAPQRADGERTVPRDRGSSLAAIIAAFCNNIGTERLFWEALDPERPIREADMSGPVLLRCKGDTSQGAAQKRSSPSTGR